MANVPLTFSAPKGIVFSQCGLNVCNQPTDQYGRAGTGVVGTAAGTYTLTVSYGAVSQSVQLVVTVPQPHLRIVSAPTGIVPVGTLAPQLFTAQLLDQNGNPWSGMAVTLGGPLGSVSMSCEANTGSCVEVTDANGMVSSQVTPLMAGVITLEAVFSDLVAQSSFTAAGAPETFTVVTPPPAMVNAGSALSFTLQAIGPDGKTPEVNHAAYFATSSGTFAYQGCAAENCKFNTDQNGLITVRGTAWVTGTVTIQAVLDGLTAVVSFNVVQPAQTMKVLSAPSGDFQLGAAISPAYVVQAVGADGVTGVSAQNVTFSATGAGAAIAACAMPCVVKTNASGVASTGTITVSGPGAITLTAADNGMSQVAQFRVVGAPDVVSVVSAPASVYVGATAATLLAVKVTLADGVTPVAGIPVNFSLGAGSGVAVFAACGASSCGLTTNAAGVASSQVKGTQVGQVTLEATAQLSTGAATVSAPSVVEANTFAVTALVPQFFFAEGATVAETLSLIAVEDGTAAGGQTVSWTGSGEFSLSAGSSTTDVTGAASMQATVGPLAGGASVTASGCVWGTICAQFTATAVSAEVWQVTVVSGGNQSVGAGVALNPVVVQVTDQAGHGLPGATVTVGQTVRAFGASCPAEGRCPAGAVLASGESSGVADARGEVSIAPMVLPGVATTTSLAFSAGFEGFATAVVSSLP